MHVFCWTVHVGVQDQSEKIVAFIPAGDRNWADSHEAVQDKLVQHAQEACRILRLWHHSIVARSLRQVAEVVLGVCALHLERAHAGSILAGFCGGAMIAAKAAEIFQNAHMKVLEIIFLSGVPGSNQACSIIILGYAWQVLPPLAFQAPLTAPVRTVRTPKERWSSGSRRDYFKGWCLERHEEQR